MYKETFPRPIIAQNVYCYCSSSDVRKCFNFCCCDKFQSKVTEYEVRWESYTCVMHVQAKCFRI